MKGDSKKWKNLHALNKKWDTASSRTIQRKEARQILNWLSALDWPHLDILEIGCGNGYLGLQILNGLERKNRSFTYTFSDLLEECLEVSQKNIGHHKNKKTVRFQNLDVYQLDQHFEPGSQTLILSTGFASAASYKEAVPLISKSLKKEGILICDFVNHLSPLLLPSTLIRGVKSSYHVGRWGIKKYFRENGLEAVHSKSIGLMGNPLIYLFRKV